MSERFPIPDDRSSLRRFLITWTAGAVLAICLMNVVAVVTTTSLQRMTHRVRTDAASITTASEFGRVILAQRRDDLLWHITREREYLDKSALELLRADQLVGSLRATVTSDEERTIVEEIEEAYRSFRSMAPESGHRNVQEVSPAAERLLNAVTRLRDMNVREMDATNAESAALNAVVDRFSLVTFLVLSLIVIAAASRLWSRIIRPTIGLSEAARAFGVGDLGARAPILVEDELGEVCRTFNGMAAEIAARERERLDFLATVAHDLRNPLTVIGGTTNLLRRSEETASAKRLGWYDRVLAQARRLEAMTFDLTNAVQVQTGRLILDIKPFDLAELIRDIVEEQTRIDQERHRILCRGDGSCVLRGDKARLERVFANLLSNAAKYSGEETEIRVEMKRAGDRVVVTCADQGIGISPDDLRELFKPFRRAVGARGVARGTGLGLFSVQRIVEAHGGRVEIRSELSVGTTVEVTLPLEEGAPVAGAAGNQGSP